MKFIKDSSKVTISGKAFGKIEVETEYPQFDSVEELQQSAGSVKEFLDWANRIIKAQSKGRVLALTTTYNKEDNTTSAEVAAAKAKEVRRGYTLANSRSGVSKAEKANRFDEVSKLVSGFDDSNMSLEDIREQLQKLKAIAAA